MSFNISGLNKSWLFVSYLYPAVICSLWVCIMYFCVGKVCWKMISRNVHLNWCWKHQIETSRTDKIACNKRILNKKLISVKFVLVHKVYSKNTKIYAKPDFTLSLKYFNNYLQNYDIKAVIIDKHFRKKFVVIIKI